MRSLQAELQRAAGWDEGLLDRSQDLLCEHNLEGQLLFANGVMARLLGYTPEEILQVPIRDFVNPKFRTEFDTYLREIARKRQAEGVLPVITRAGERRYWEFHSTLRSEPVERPVVHSIGHDVTERVLAARALRLTNKKLVETARKQEAMLRELQLFRTLLDQSNDAIDVIEPETLRLLDVNEKACQELGYSREELLSMTVFDIDPMVTPELVASRVEELRKSKSLTLESVHRRKDGTTFPVEVNVRHVQLDREYIVAVSRDISERKRAEALVSLEKDTLETIAKGMPMQHSLTTLVRLVESLCPGLQGSILLLDEDGVHVRHGAAPSLPQAYINAIDGAAIGPTAGSCGTAMYRKEPVIVTDIAQDPLWKSYRDLALPHGLRACWSSPIFSSAGKVLGSFAMYYGHLRSPSARELRLIEVASDLASVAIERQQSEGALRRSEESYRNFVAQSSEGIFRQDVDTPIPIDLPEDELVHRILYDSYMAECNDAMVKMYGLDSVQDFLGRRLAEFVDPGKPRNIELTREYIRSGFRVLERESRETDAQGNPKVFRNSMIGIVEDGKLIRTWGIQRDVTEQVKLEESRRNAEDALRASEERLRMAQEVAQIGTFDRNLITGESRWTPEIEAIYGLRPGTFPRSIDKFLDLIHPEDRQRVSDIVARAIECGQWKENGESSGPMAPPAGYRAVAASSKTPPEGQNG